MLSGQDLPIQKHETIRSFFEKYSKKEFVAFDHQDFRFADRVMYRYIFREKAGRTNNFWKRIEDKLLRFQKDLRIERNRNIHFQKGASWFSITDNLARYVLEQEPWIKKIFKYTLCADEIFLQTVLLNSVYLKNIYQLVNDGTQKNTMRLIDWKRGGPYIFRSADLKLLEESSLMFARKFDEKTDRTIIEQIAKLYM